MQVRRPKPVSPGTSWHLLLSPHLLMTRQLTIKVGDPMGWVVKQQPRKDGTRTYTACYRDLRGTVQSAGTFTSDKKANKAWQLAETRQIDGRVGDPRLGRQTFESYVTKIWFPNHVIEPSTHMGYRYSLNAHIIPWFRIMKMSEIMPADVREWVTHQIDGGLSPSVIAKNKTILSAIFTTALNDRVTFLHACRGVRTPTIAIKPLKIITSDQFDLIYAALPDEDMRLLAETDIESGMRWGEITELRVHDINRDTGIITVSRAVVELNANDHPTGGRFWIQEYPKDKEYRSFKVSANLILRLGSRIDRLGLGPEDLVFEMDRLGTDAERTPEAGENLELGLTEPNSKGRQYTHGTTTAYSSGRCRCHHCKKAYASYRAHRRAAGKDNPRKHRRRDTDGHIPGDWFRKRIWHPAVAVAGIGRTVRPHELRHAHASWLLAGGADLQVVMDRMGHGSITTTQRYLHTLPTADETALNALDRIRKSRPA